MIDYKTFLSYIKVSPGYTPSFGAISRSHGHTHVGGTTIFWDEDHDTRVISVTQALTESLRTRGLEDLIMEVQEHEGALTIRFSPRFYYPTQFSDEDRLKLMSEITGWVSELSGIIVGDNWVTFIEAPKR